MVINRFPIGWSGKSEYGPSSELPRLLTTRVQNEKMQARKGHSGNNSGNPGWWGKDWGWRKRFGGGGSRAVSTGKAAARTEQVAGGTSDGGESRGGRRTPVPHLRGVPPVGPSLKHSAVPSRGRRRRAYCKTYWNWNRQGASCPCRGWLHLALHIVLASPVAHHSLNTFFYPIGLNVLDATCLVAVQSPRIPVHARKERGLWTGG